MFHIVGAFAEFEREIIRERVKAGLQNAQTR
jgi:DNA invertase Pin-like site-specific DNA recombinase